MTVIINGTTGITSVNGSAAAPSVTGTDTDTGIVYGTNTVTIATGGTAGLVQNSVQGVQIANTLGVGATTPSTSGAGITFPATQSASTDANTLDDYEEGTWTPIFQINNLDSGATWLQKTGKYTKVGNLVNVWAYLYTSTGRGSGSGVVRIAGLPFTNGTLNGGNYHVADTRAGVSWSGGGAGLPFHYQPDGTTYLQFYSTANSTSSGTSGLTEANFSASGTIELNVMISYFVA